MLQIFTIGHSDLTAELFIGSLKAVSVTQLVDVRSAPYSRHAPQFNRETFKEVLKVVKIKYLYLGKELGGRPKGEEFYNANGRVLYGKYKESDEFRRGVERLLELAGDDKTAIMCSEENPVACHRRLLIGRYLRESAVEVLHIRRDGRIQTEEDVIAAECSAENSDQMELFDFEEAREWKSIRSVSLKKAPNSSLKS